MISFVRRRLRFNLLRNCMISIMGYRGTRTLPPTAISDVDLNLINTPKRVLFLPWFFKILYHFYNIVLGYFVFEGVYPYSKTINIAEIICKYVYCSKLIFL